jgi:hypothetical protein
MPAAWDAQDSPLPPPEQHRYPAQQAQRRHWGQPAERPSTAAPGQRRSEVRLPVDALDSSDSDGDDQLGAAAAHEQEEAAAAPSGSSGGIMLAVSNPLFGSSRPGTAQGVHSMHGMLPPKRSLGRQRSTSLEEASADAGAQARQPLHRQQRSSPQLSAGPLQSMQSMGSGFSGEAVGQPVEGALAACLALRMCWLQCCT